MREKPEVTGTRLAGFVVLLGLGWPLVALGMMIQLDKDPTREFAGLNSAYLIVPGLVFMTFAFLCLIKPRPPKKPPVNSTPEKK